MILSFGTVFGFLDFFGTIFGHDHRQGCPCVQGPGPSGEEIDSDHKIHLRHEGAEDDACGIERMILFLFSFTSGKG